jgi:hypothetical protein
MDEHVADLRERNQCRTESEHSSQPPSPVDRRRRRSSSANGSFDDTEDDNSSTHCYAMDRAFGRVASGAGIFGASSFAAATDDGLQQQTSAGDMTSSYRKRRLKNNEAARKSREKRRRLDAELRRQLELVIAENQSLRYELKLLRTACGLPTADRRRRIRVADRVRRTVRAVAVRGGTAAGNRRRWAIACSRRRRRRRRHRVSSRCARQVGTHRERRSRDGDSPADATRDCCDAAAAASLRRTSATPELRSCVVQASTSGAGGGGGVSQLLAAAAGSGNVFLRPATDAGSRRSDSATLTVPLIDR